MGADELLDWRFRRIVPRLNKANPDSCTSSSLARSDFPRRR